MELQDKQLQIINMENIQFLEVIPQIDIPIEVDQETLDQEIPSSMELIEEVDTLIEPTTENISVE